jgi:hypothetical protein
MIISLQGAMAIRALRNKEVMEQFLGPTDPSGPPGIAVVTVWPLITNYARTRWAVTLHEVREIDDGEWHSLQDLPPLDKREKRGMGRDLVLRDTPREALEYAEWFTGATRDRWVTCFKTDRQYEDWMEAGRPPLPSAAAAAARRRQPAP